jgi:hypothetical protein
LLETAAEANRQSDLDDKLTRELGSLMSFFKPYEGPFIRHGRTIPRVRFYDEREWRWLPPNFHDIPVLSKEACLDFAQRAEGNVRIRENVRLPFEPSDIRYILVATEAEILPMINAIDRIKGPKYLPDAVRVLTSRIVAADQIESDF